MIRSLALASLLLLSACGDDAAGTRAATNSSASGESVARGEDAPSAGEVELVECAIAGADFERTCTVERAAGAEGLVLTIRAPNGSFRRLLVTGDGRGLVAADGAMPAVVTPLGADLIEVKIAADRYRLPARVGQGAAPNPAR